MIALTVQLMIEPARRRYDDATRERLAGLFGPPERWSVTTRSLRLGAARRRSCRRSPGRPRWRCRSPCNYDLEVAAAKYLRSLADGEAPLALHFNGVVYYRGDDGGLQMALIPWSRSIGFRMPVAVWQETIEHYYPNTGWVALRSRDARAPSSARRVRRRARDARRLRARRCSRRPAMADALEQLVDSLLWEGYALYPYTPGATKNATPTPFGIVYPPAYAASAHEHLRPPRAALRPGRRRRRRGAGRGALPGARRGGHRAEPALELPRPAGRARPSGRPSSSGASTATARDRCACGSSLRCPGRRPGDRARLRVENRTDCERRPRPRRRRCAARCSRPTRCCGSAAAASSRRSSGACAQRQHLPGAGHRRRRRRARRRDRPARPPAARAREPRRPVRLDRDRGGAAAARAGAERRRAGGDRSGRPGGARDGRAGGGGHAGGDRRPARPRDAARPGDDRAAHAAARSLRRPERRARTRPRSTASPFRRGGHVRIRPGPDADLHARMLDGRAATIERIFVDYDGKTPPGRHGRRRPRPGADARDRPAPVLLRPRGGGDRP